VEPPVACSTPSAATLPELHDVLQAAWAGPTATCTSSGRPGPLPHTRPDFAADDPDLRDERPPPCVTSQRRSVPLRLWRYWHHDIENLGPGGPEPGASTAVAPARRRTAGGPATRNSGTIAEPTHPEHKHLTSWAGPWTDVSTARHRCPRPCHRRAGPRQRPAAARPAPRRSADPGRRLPWVVVRGTRPNAPPGRC
jgi:hypothetical protein